MYELRRKQLIKADLETVWNFISSPSNLETITPDTMKFTILTNVDNKGMYPGQIIRYRISPFLKLQMNWVTEITHVKDRHFFVDEQRFGPYKFWHHQHQLIPTSEGIEMVDIVHYKLPLGFLGKMAHALFVRKQLETIFNFRYQKIEELFNSKK